MRTLFFQAKCQITGATEPEVRNIVLYPEEQHTANQILMPKNIAGITILYSSRVSV